MLRYHAVPESVKDLLLLLAPNPALDAFALGGGTSLALRFGHRLSVDLDFFTLDTFLPESLFDGLNLRASTITGRAANTLMMDVSGVKLDLLRHSYPLLSPFEREEDVTLISLPDLAAMKLNAIANRGSKKDFYDLSELLNHYSLGEMIEFFSQKYQSTDAFTVIRSLAWFEDAEMEPDPIPLVGQIWSSVKKRVQSAVGNL